MNGSEKAYVIFVEELIDWERYLNDYIPTATETMGKYGGTVLISHPDPQVIEGEWEHGLTVVLEFPSIEDAQAWYDDPAYQNVKPIRTESTEYSHAALFPAFSPEDLPA